MTPVLLIWNHQQVDTRYKQSPQEFGRELLQKKELADKMASPKIVSTTCPAENEAVADFPRIFCGGQRRDLWRLHQ